MEPEPLTAASPRFSARRLGRGRVAVIAAAGLVAAVAITSLTTSLTAAPDAAGHSFFTGADVSRVPTDPETAPIEVGLRFAVTSAGTVTAIRFLRAHGDTAAHPVRLWSGAGARLASVTSGPGPGGAWHEVPLPDPVAIGAGEYVVSYHTTRYRASEEFFDRPLRAGPLTTTGDAGVYAYGAGGFPDATWRSSNYWVDLVFRPVSATPTVPGTAPATPTPTVPGTPTPTGTGTPAPTGTGAPSPVPVPWEGGPAYYAAYPAAAAAGWTDPAFFPIAVWQESVREPRDTALDRAAGLNTYLSPTANSDLALIRAAGMHAVASSPAQESAAVLGWFLADEVDMWAGPGDSAWTGNYPGQGPICRPAESRCGYTVQRTLLAGFPTDGRPRFGNYGKGVIFWETDAEAGRFVDDFTAVVSADIYWYTDPHVCVSPSEGPSLGVTPATCRRAANYGRTMDRMRALDARDGRRQPIFAFVEVGHPFTEDDAPTITAGQIAGAVMNSLIHGARGISYFNHNFGGPCISQHVLRDACGAAVRPTVAETNRRIRSLAPVLNTRSYAWPVNPALDSMIKIHDGAYYLFAMPGRTGGTGTQRLALPPGLAGAPAEVLFEGRTVPTTGGVIVDNFAREHSYHVYRITP